MKFSRVAFILNRNSGQSSVSKSRTESEIKRISQSCSTYILDKDLDLKVALRNEKKNGAELVIACGGDGTVLAVAEAIYGLDIPLAVLPFGTANVFAAELGISANSMHLIDLIESGRFKTRAVDIGLAGNKKFLLRFGLGWEAVMSKETPAIMKKKIGKISYLSTALTKRRDLKKSTYRIKTELFKKKIKGYGCMVCNSANLGLPGLKLLPGIKIDDGELNVVIVKKSSFKSIVQFLLNLVLFYRRSRNTKVDDFLLASFPAKEIIIEKDPHQPAAVDGEVIECKYPLRIKVLEKALEVIVPSEHE